MQEGHSAVLPAAVHQHRSVDSLDRDLLPGRSARPCRRPRRRAAVRCMAGAASSVRRPRRRARDPGTSRSSEQRGLAAARRPLDRARGQGRLPGWARSSRTARAKYSSGTSVSVGRQSRLLEVRERRAPGSRAPPAARRPRAPAPGPGRPPSPPKTTSARPPRRRVGGQVQRSVYAVLSRAQIAVRHADVRPARPPVRSQPAPTTFPSTLARSVTSSVRPPAKKTVVAARSASSARTGAIGSAVG